MTTSVDPEVTALDEGPTLTAVLSERYALGLKHVLATALFTALFVVLNHLPLRPTDLWCHVTYGKWITSHLALPSEDPFMPLSEGIDVVDTAWLAQIIFAQVEAWGGAEWLSNLFALTVLATYLVLARTFYLQTRRLGLTLGGVLVVLVVGFSRLTTIRPENFAALAFALLLWLLARGPAGGPAGDDQATTTRARRAPPWALWVGVPILFAFWANVHGSFVCGLAVLGSHLAGRVVEVAWCSRSPRAVLADRGVRRWLYLTELAAAATLANPYGIDLWLGTVAFPGHENLRDLTEWDPMVILGTGGREFALSSVLLLVVLRHSRRRLPAADVFLLALFAAAAVAQIRMLVWYAPVVVLVLMPHLAELAGRFWPAQTPLPEAPGPSGRPDVPTGRPGAAALAPGRSWRYSLVSLALVWTAFTFSGLSRPVLGGAPRSRQALYGDMTPLGVTQYLREHPPAGQVYNLATWGDWLVWDGPPGLRPFATSNVHLVPRQVWRDYMRIYAVRPNWQEALDRYRVTTVVLDKDAQELLASVMRREPDWKIAYEDEQALVLERKAQPQDRRSTEPRALRAGLKP